MRIPSYNNERMTRTLTIIGCGYLGHHFLRQFGHRFSNIVTTSKASFPEFPVSHHHFFDLYSSTRLPIASDWCLISIPFSRQLADPWAYPHGLQQLVPQISQKTAIVFISSTSIYPCINNWVTESSQTDITNRARALRAAEQAIETHPTRSIILRAAGLCGYNRYSRMTPAVPNANAPVNLIHIDDLNHFIWHLMVNPPAQSDIINVCCPEHPTKADYYRYQCAHLNTPPPSFLESDAPFKRVDTTKMTMHYAFTPHYSSPLQFPL